MCVLNPVPQCKVPNLYDTRRQQAADSPVELTAITKIHLFQRGALISRDMAARSK